MSGVNVKPLAVLLRYRPSVAQCSLIGSSSPDMMSVDCGRPRVHRANLDRHSLGHLELSAGPVTGRLAEVTNALATVADRY